MSAWQTELVRQGICLVLPLWHCNSLVSFWRARTVWQGHSCRSGSACWFDRISLPLGSQLSGGCRLSGQIFNYDENKYYFLRTKRSPSAVESFFIFRVSIFVAITSAYVHLWKQSSRLWAAPTVCVPWGFPLQPCLAGERCLNWHWTPLCYPRMAGVYPMINSRSFGGWY